MSYFNWKVRRIRHDPTTDLIEYLRFREAQSRWICTSSIAGFVFLAVQARFIEFDLVTRSAWLLSILCFSLTSVFGYSTLLRRGANLKVALEARYKGDANPQFQYRENTGLSGLVVNLFSLLFILAYCSGLFSVLSPALLRQELFPTSSAVKTQGSSFFQSTAFESDGFFLVRSVHESSPEQRQSVEEFRLFIDDALMTTLGEHELSRDEIIYFRITLNFLTDFDDRLHQLFESLEPDISFLSPNGTPDGQWVRLELVALRRGNPQ